MGSIAPTGTSLMHFIAQHEMTDLMGSPQNHLNGECRKAISAYALEGYLNGFIICDSTVVNFLAMYLHLFAKFSGYIV